MVERTYDFRLYSRDSMFEFLNAISPRAVSDIASCEGESLRTYARKVWQTDSIEESILAENARGHLHAALTAEVEAQHDHSTALAALAEFKRNPVFQTGPHMQLAVEANTFYSGLFSLMGMKEIGLRYYFQSSCTTPTLQSRSFYGPGWLNVHDSNFNVFGLSWSARKASEYCASGEFEFKFEPHYGSAEIPGVMGYIDRLKGLLGGVVYSSVVEAFHDANHKIWSRCLSAEYVPVFLDEDFYRRLVLAHLRDPSSYMYRFFSDWTRQEAALSRVAADADLAWASMIPMSTHFFWRVAGRRVRPVRFEGEWICDADDAHEFRIANCVDALIEGLESGELVPSIFTHMFAESFAGLSRVAGGLHQFAYYPTLQAAFLSSLQENREDERELRNVVLASHLNHWGSHVFEPAIDVMELVREGEMSYDKCLREYEDYAFADAIDDLIQFRKYFRWGELICGP